MSSRTNAPPVEKFERLSVSLPVEVVRFVRSQVESGRYFSDSQAISEALEAWQAREAQHQHRLEQLRRKIAEAESDPRPSLTDEEVERHFRDRLRAYE